jgi:hypothetical protein
MFGDIPLVARRRVRFVVRVTSPTSVVTNYNVSDLTAPIVMATPGNWTVVFFQAVEAAFKVWGAGGASGNNYQGSAFYKSGGAGGAATGSLTPAAGTTYIVRVGARGLLGAAGAAGGAYSGGGTGGEYTGVFAGSVSHANSLLIAGGGGGGGGQVRSGTVHTGGVGGAGGGTTGASGGLGDPARLSVATGGSQTAGGLGGDDVGGSGREGNPGGALTVGAQKIGIPGRNPTGGGGYYGGGGGGGAWGTTSDYSGGAGGSGYFHPTNVIGGALYGGTGTTPGLSSDADRAGAGDGGTAANGNNGFDGRAVLSVIVL